MERKNQRLRTLFVAARRDHSTTLRYSQTTLRYSQTTLKLLLNYSPLPLNYPQPTGRSLNALISSSRLTSLVAARRDHSTTLKLLSATLKLPPPSHTQKNATPKSRISFAIFSLIISARELHCQPRVPQSSKQSPSPDLPHG